MQAASLTVGSWQVDLASGNATDGHKHLVLRPREVDVLRALAARGGGIVSVNDLLADAWHGAVVSNDALYFSISQLRKALDAEDAAVSIIETVPKRGYRLTVPVVHGEAGSDARQVRRAQNVAAGRRPGWRVAATAAVLLLALAVGMVLTGERGGDAAVPPNSIAVMPFVDLTPGADYTYFSDGITEEILNRLTRIPGLQVAARTSSFSFKNQAVDIADIAHALGVSAVLEGSVRKDGERVRIAVQLIDAVSGYQLWSASYERQLSSVFELQNEISRRIVDALQPALGIELGALPATTAQQPDPRAFDEYLLGLEQQRRNSFDGLQSAARRYQRALAIDPAFVQANIALAETKLEMLRIGASNDGSLLPEAKALINQALAHDAGNSEGYRLLAAVKFLEDKPDEAEELLQRSLRLAPSNAAALVDRASLYASRGELDEAMQALQRAERIDPLGDDVLIKLGHVQWNRGQLEQARATWERAATVHPDNPAFPSLLGMLQVFSLGELAGGLQNFLHAAQLDPRDYEIAAYVAMSYLTLDMPEAARPWIDRAMRQAPLAATSPALESVWLMLADDVAGAASLSANVLGNPRAIYRGHRMLWESHYIVAIAGLLADDRVEDALQLLHRNAALRAKMDAPGLADTREIPDISPHATRLLLSFASVYRAAQNDEAAATMLDRVALPETGMKAIAYRGAGLDLLQAEIRALAGDREGALDLLERVAEVGPLFNWQILIAANSAYRSLRNTERFNEVLDTLGATVALQRQRLPAAARLSQRRRTATVSPH